MKIGIAFKNGSEKAQKVVGEVEKYFKSKNVEAVGEENLKGADYILSFGGDGTLIHNASQYAELGIPLIGINTGKIGFLTAVEADDWREVFEDLISGRKPYISERMTLDIASESVKHRAVNEAVIKGIFRVCDLKIIVNEEEFVTVSGDGVLISTQTGSTGYSLSSGGSIVDPEIDSMIVTFINPIGLPIPSVVLSPKDVIEVEVLNDDDVSLIIDGQEHEKLKKGQKIRIVKGKYSVKFGYFDKHQFLKSLNAKFGLANRATG